MQRLGVFAVMCLALGCSSGTGGSGTATPNASGGSEGFTGQLTLLDDSRNQVDISSAHPDEQAALTELAQAAVADANLNPEMRTVALLIQTTEGTSLKSFQGFTKLQHIDFAGPGINDEVMAGLKDCTGLEIVQLQKTSVTDAGLAHLAGASGLKVLQVHDAPITGAGLALVPQVKSLILGRRTKVQGDGFAPMEGMQCTVARFIEFDDAALKHVAKMPKLEVLEFPNTAVTDEGVVALKGHPSLSRLALDGVKLGGAGLAALAEAPNLSYLSASGTPITDADLAPDQRKQIAHGAVDQQHQDHGQGIGGTGRDDHPQGVAYRAYRRHARGRRQAAASASRLQHQHGGARGRRGRRGRASSGRWSARWRRPTWRRRAGWPARRSTRRWSRRRRSARRVQSADVMIEGHAGD
ncbi:MAG: hypothetical protein HYS13_02540 [Planctomycetia bacterium]|nr:hypothetical protein [Planctomycetia bacterium]